MTIMSAEIALASCTDAADLIFAQASQAADALRCSRRVDPEAEAEMGDLLDTIKNASALLSLRIALTRNQAAAQSRAVDGSVCLAATDATTT